MSEAATRQYLFDHPGHYQIRLLGGLDPCWVNYLEELEISTVRWGQYAQVTQINGWLADQAALSGLLNLLSDLGGVILTVERLEEEDDESNPGR